MVRKILIGLNGLMVVWAGFVVFYTVLPGVSCWIMPEVLQKHGFFAWAMMNTAFIAQVAATIGLITKNKPIMNFTIPYLIFYGVGGLLVFSWTSATVGFQVLNIIMTMTVIYIFMTAFKELHLIKLAAWVVIGTIVFIGFKFYQNSYFRSHPEIAAYFDTNK